MTIDKTTKAHLSVGATHDPRGGGSLAELIGQFAALAASRHFVPVDAPAGTSAGGTEGATHTATYLRERGMQLRGAGDQGPVLVAHPARTDAASRQIVAHVAEGAGPQNRQTPTTDGAA